MMFRKRIQAIWAAFCTYLLTYLYFIAVQLPGTKIVSKVELSTDETFDYVDHFDHDGPFKQLWPNNANCSRFVTRFGKGLNVTFLVSYPRSGNFWLRYLVEGASGLATGTVYKDSRNSQLGFLGEMESVRSGRTILIKSHAQGISPRWTLKQRLSIIKIGDPVILLIRNPERSILSHWHFVLGGKRPDAYFYVANNTTYNTTKFRHFVAESIHYWKEVIEDRLVWSSRLLVVFYEHLEKRPIRELRRVLRFLQLYEDGDRLKCVRENLQGDLMRNHTKIKTPFSKSAKLQLGHAISSIIGLLKIRKINKIPQIYLNLLRKYTTISIN